MAPARPWPVVVVMAVMVFYVPARPRGGSLLMEKCFLSFLSSPDKQLIAPGKNWCSPIGTSMYINIHLYSPFTLLKALLIVQTLLLWTCGEDFAVKHPNFWWRHRLCFNCKCLSIYLEWYLIRFRSVNAPSLNIL